MKIEKVSETQIRCTLNQDDLATRHLHISELAYGSDKAKALFRDMMQKASSEFGFDADNIPLMIEAIPVSPECLILVITKVEDPDELDTRFSNFTPTREDIEDFESFENEEDTNFADEILNCFKELGDVLTEKLSDTSEKAVSKKAAEAENPDLSAEEEPKDLIRSFRFSALHEVTAAAAIVAPFYHGSSTLFKNPSDGIYHLMLQVSASRPTEHNKVCNILTEYGTLERTSAANIAFFEEHMECIIRNRAIQVLSKL